MASTTKDDFFISTNTFNEKIISPINPQKQWRSVRETEAFINDLIVPFAEFLQYTVTKNKKIIRIELRKRFTVFVEIIGSSTYEIRFYSRNMSMNRLNTFMNSFFNYLKNSDVFKTSRNTLISVEEGEKRGIEGTIIKKQEKEK